MPLTGSYFLIFFSAKEGGEGAAKLFKDIVVERRTERKGKGE